MFDWSWSLILPLALMLLLGFPHGAYDGPLLWQYSSSPKRFLALVTGYLALAGSAFLFWQWYTETAFAIFMLLALLHFGFSDVRDGRIRHKLFAVFSFGGVFTILLPYWHEVPVRELLTLQSVLHERFYWAVHSVLLPLWLLASAGMLASLLRTGNNRELLLFVCMVAVVLALPPLWALCTYFCGIHAKRHTQLVRSLLADNDTAKRQMIWIMVAAAVMVLALPGLFLSHLAPDAALLRIFFGGLFALTVPHMVLVDWLLPKLMYARIDGLPLHDGYSSHDS